MTSNEAPIRQKLEGIAGIRPSEHWLEDCLSELRLMNDATPDAILMQILHHDLRDVVRTFDENQNPTAHPSSRSMVDAHQTLPSVLLRQAMHQSQSLDSKKVALPESFRLLVQVEELLDISVNAETRLSVGPASAHDPSPIGPQSSRCLKLLLSDGYTASGSPVYGSNHTRSDDNSAAYYQNALVAMETAPIKELSVNSLAGIKVLLHGPLDVRLGVLLLHPGNTRVLGGRVQELVRIQRQALQQAKLVAGVGVDPTIKALIWNPDTGLGNEEEEGEEASGDVVAPTRPIVTPASANRANQSLHSSLPGTRSPALSVIQGSAGSYQNSNPYGARPPVPPRGNSQSVLPPRPNPYQASVSASNNSNVSHLGPPARTNINPSARIHPAAPSPSSARAGLNPYAKSSSTSGISASSASTSANPYGPGLAETRRVQQPASMSPSTFVPTSSQINTDISNYPRQPVMPPPRPQPPSNVMTSSSLTTYPASSHRISPNNDTRLTSTAQSYGSGVDNDKAEFMSDAMSISSTPNYSHTGSLPVVATNSAVPMDISMESTLTPQVPIRSGFDEFRNLVSRVMSNRVAYSHVFLKTYAVSMQQQGPKLHFNIEKRKNRSKGDKGDKYEYVMLAKFVGSPHSGAVTCKISNRILSQYFSTSPDHMRKLNRTDRASAEVMVRDGGKLVQAATKQMTEYSVKLLLSPEEFFTTDNSTARTVDGAEPILYIVGVV